MPLIAGYKILEKLHSGSNINIYRCERLRDKKVVVLKMPNNEHPAPKDIIKLQYEYYLLQLINYPSVIKAYELIQTPFNTILVLEDLSGQSLENFLAKKPLSLKDFFLIALSLTDTIYALHQKNIIHRDIKPANIIINLEDHSVKLIDFSISTQFMEKESQLTELINPNSLEGTLPYMSPEQTGRTNHSVDFRTDLYSLGVTFFEMLTGRLPFESTDLLENVHNHLAKSAPLASEINPEVPNMLSNIIAKLLAKIPDHRYNSAPGLMADLELCKEQWQNQGYINEFKLAQHDASDRLTLSRKLYGREEPLKRLTMAFEDTYQGTNKFLLIVGFPGIGKTSIVKELIHQMGNKKVYFVNGKYDQLQKHIPYSAIIMAFQHLMKQLLVAPEAEFQRIQKALIKALGNVGQVIIDTVPEAELILGQQPALPPLNPAETQNRFQWAFENLIKVFAQASHPLIIFLDDLQWADSASLDFLRDLLTKSALSHLLLIGTYRDNEIEKDHPLTLLLQDLENTKIKTQTIALNPLALGDIVNLLQDSLNTKGPEVNELAALLQEKTLGNPFFINEFIKHLYQEKLLEFSHEKNSWQWNIKQIKAERSAENVIDLLIDNIHKLPEDTQFTLQLAACIGHTFDFITLAAICEQPVKSVAQQLLRLMEINFIHSLEDVNKTTAYIEKLDQTLLTSENITYSFNDDRIQQAAYELTSEDSRLEIHLKIGRWLLKNTESLDSSAAVYNLLEHFNKSLSLVTEPKERLFLAELNLKAGKAAKAATAYQIAKEYLQAGISLLTTDAWKDHYELTFDLHKELAECLYLTGDHAQAVTYFEISLKNVKSKIDRAAIYMIQMALYHNIAKFEESIDVGLKALKLFNINLPKNPSTLRIVWNILLLKRQANKQNVQTFNLLPMTDPEQQVVVKIISNLQTACFIANQPLFALIICQQVNLALKYGYTAEVPMSLMLYAHILANNLKQFKLGFAFANLSHEIQNLIPNPSIASGNNLSWGLFLQHWQTPLSEVPKTLLAGYKASLESGNLIYACYNLYLLGEILFSIGKPIKEVIHAVDKSIFFAAKSKIKQGLNLYYFLLALLRYLQDAKSSTEPQLQKQFDALAGEKEVQLAYLYYIRVLYLFGNYSLALKLAIESRRKYEKLMAGQYRLIENQVFYALSLAATLNGVTRLQHYRGLRQIKKIQRAMAQNTAQHPTNFEHFNALLLAEIARLENNPTKAMHYYDKAINLATHGHFMQYIAIANERAALFYLAIDHPKLAKPYLLDAHYAYQSWGALAKCQLLEKEYPAWFESGATTITATTRFVSTTATGSSTDIYQLDMVALLKSTQIIAGEIQMDKLLQKLLDVVLEQAGAQRVVLMAEVDNKWVIEAEGTIDQPHQIFNPPLRVQDYSELPHSIVRYMQRTKALLIGQGDAVAEPLMMTDSYFTRSKPLSWLMLSIQRHRQIKYLLYLENKIIANAFTPQRLQSLQLLATQATISLKNAQLYYQATHDPLTKLANRNLLYQVFNLAVARAKRINNFIAILYLDLDGFKKYNDTLGHEIGDKILIYFSEQLKACVRADDLVVRLGGDEFIVMAENTNVAEIMLIAEKLLNNLKNSIDIQGHTIYIGTSIGVSLYPTDGEDIATLLKLADIALYRVKGQGKGNFKFYSTALDSQVKNENQLEIELHNALERNEFCMYYEPVYQLNPSKILYFESLIRWNHPTQGLLKAEKFIFLAEKNGLILPIGEWVVKTTVQQIRAWQKEGLTPLPIAMNISGARLKIGLSGLLSEALTKNQVDPKFIELEFTESVFIDHTENVFREIQMLEKLGVNLTLDDFGTYYSSLSYLRRLPVSKIKIDKSFIQDIEQDEKARQLISAIISMAHNLKLQVIAEGVETAAQLSFLEDQRVDGIQGYYLSPSLTAEQCRALIKDKSMQIS